MAHLGMEFLGGFRVTHDGTPLTAFESNKVRALLAYLATESQRPHPRESLAGLLWPDWPDRAALSNLRYALADLRKVIGDRNAEPPFLLINREAIQFNAESDHWLDVAEFARLADEQDVEQLEQAVKLYQGDFLEGFSVSEAAPFEDWARLKNAQLRHCYLEVLHRLAAALEGCGEFERALPYARRQVEVEPLDESGHRQVMRLLALSGRRAEALAQYDSCQEVLEKELGATPSKETEELYQILKSGELPPTMAEVLPPLRPLRRVGACPYRGLAAFREQDAPFFFGREEFTRRLEEAIRDRSLIAVIVGSSGSGKSSVVYAGLLPHLRTSGEWQIACFRPGEYPFRSLASVLLPLLEPDLSETDRLIQAGKLEAALSQGEVSLASVAVRAAQMGEASGHLLLVADQFEEIYTLCPDPGERRRFLDELLGTVSGWNQRRDGRFVLLLTLRADFMGQALAYRPFADALQGASVLMGPMNREELRSAVEKPAELQGAAFETGLVDRLLDDVGEEPGNLPLLEFALTLLWKHQESGWLTHTAYEGIGRVEGALASYADQVYASLDGDEQESARKTLLQLVQPGEGTADTRRVALKAELGEGDWQVIQRLADRRLVVTGRDAAGNETAEVVHEALIQKWGLFREWMEADRSFRAWQERLRANLRQWQESGQDEGALLAGAPLSVAEGWLSERGDDLNQAERGFIQESQALQARRQRERQRRRQRTVLGLAAGLVIALVLAGLAIFQRQAAKMQAGVLLASQAESELESGNADRAILLALAALENYPYTPQAEHALGQAVTYNRSLALHTGHTSAVTGADWSSDGGRIATSSNDNTVHIWDSATGELIRQINLPEGITGNIYDWAQAVQWSPDDRYLLTVSGDRFLTGSQDYDLIMWDAETGAQVAAQEVQNSTPPSTGEVGTTSQLRFMTGAAAAFAGDGRLATVGGDNTALIWRPMLGDQPLVLSGHSAGVNAVTWSPDFTRLATTSEDGTARIWDAQTGGELMILVSHSAAVNQVAWSPDGSRIATGGKDGSVWLWDGTSGEKLTSIQMASASSSSQVIDLVVWSLAWSPDGSKLATGTGDGFIRLWDVDSGELLIEIKGHDQYATYVAWSPQADHLVSAGADGKARVWNVARDNMVLSLPYDYVWTGEWSPDGKSFVVATDPGPEKMFKGLVSMWDFNTRKPLFETSGNKDGTWYWIWATFTPDGKYFISRNQLKFPDTTDANRYYMFDSQSGEIVRTFDTGTDTLLLGAGISPDGKLVGAGDFKGNIFFWETSTGKLVRTMNCLAWGHLIQWSPDGKKIALFCMDFEKSLNSVYVLDARTYETLLTIEKDLLLDPLQWISWSPDSTRIAVTGGNDETGSIINPIYVFDASSGKELLKIVKHTGQTFGVDWSPDGKRLVTGSTDDTTRIWDAQTGVELLTLSTPCDWWTVPSWSPDGKYLIVPIGNISGPGRSGVWRVWQTTQELIDYARECCVFRQLTEAERQQFALP